MPVNYIGTMGAPEIAIHCFMRPHAEIARSQQERDLNERMN